MAYEYGLAVTHHHETESGTSAEVSSAFHITAHNQTFNDLIDALGIDPELSRLLRAHHFDRVCIDRDVLVEMDLVEMPSEHGAWLVNGHEIWGTDIRYLANVRDLLRRHPEAKLHLTMD